MKMIEKREIEGMCVCVFVCVCVCVCVCNAHGVR